MTTQVDIHKHLIEGCKKNKSSSQHELYELYARAMFSICMRLLSSREDAEDALQEAFITAFHRIGSFEYKSTFGAWLKRIVVNQCIDHLRKKKLEFDDDEQQLENLEEEDHTGNEQEVQLTVQRIQKAMKLLPEGGRIIFSLYLMEGYDHKEIAKILNISESTSKSQYMRAKRKVTELVKSMNNE